MTKPIVKHYSLTLGETWDVKAQQLNQKSVIVLFVLFSQFNIPKFFKEKVIRKIPYVFHPVYHT